jgi:hypothetical protein
VLPVCRKPCVLLETNGFKLLDMIVTEKCCPDCSGEMFGPKTWRTEVQLVCTKCYRVFNLTKTGVGDVFMSRGALTAFKHIYKSKNKLSLDKFVERVLIPRMGIKYNERSM